MEHHFNRMQPAILNEHNMDTLNHLLNQFINEMKGEIEAWSHDYFNYNPDIDNSKNKLLSRRNYTQRL